jgi:formylglycine-generating enzyme required for sulfatase activity
MQSRILGLLMVMAVLVFIGCPNTTTDTTKGTHADLSGLSIDSGTLNPIFSSATTAYTVNVANTVSSITVTGTKADTNATVTSPVTLGDLVVGVAQTATITVTAQDGTTTKAYTVTVTRAAAISTDSDLSSLSVDNGTLTPLFSAGTTTYRVSVQNTVQSITVSGIKNDTNASIAINPVQPMVLQTGENIIRVTVTAQSGASKIYNITVDRISNYASPNIGTLIGVPAGNYTRDATITNTSALTAFRMSQYEITQSQWMLVTGSANPSKNVSPVVAVTDYSRPVDKVSWYDAIEFCNKLSILEGLLPIYSISERIPSNGSYPITSANVTATWSNNGYRLPTETEWLWACMGAINDITKKFAGSTGNNIITDYAWISENALSYGYGNPGYGSHAVGTKLPNELGLYDMTGNLCEWTWDWYATFPSGPLSDYRGPDTGTSHMIDGFAWPHPQSMISIAARYAGFAKVPEWTEATIGFRVVRQ